MNVAGDQVRLFHLEDARDSLKIFSWVDVAGREIVQDLFTSRSSWKENVRDSLKKERDFHHHYPAGWGVVDKNRRCDVKPNKTVIFSRSDNREQRILKTFSQTICGRCYAKPNSSGETARSVPWRNQESSSSWQLSGCFDCSQVRYRWCRQARENLRACSWVIFSHFHHFWSFAHTEKNDSLHACVYLASLLYKY